jgi:hypothetical protein
VGGRARPLSDSTYGEVTQSFLLLSNVKLLRLGCRSSAFGKSRVPALLVFYSSFSSQNTMLCKSHCIKIPPIMSKLKGEKMFHKTCSDTLCGLAPSCPFHLPFHFYCYVAQAWRYFASTVRAIFGTGRLWRILRYHSKFCVEGLRKPTDNFRQCSRYLNQKPPEVIISQLRHSFQVLFCEYLCSSNLA